MPRLILALLVLVAPAAAQVLPARAWPATQAIRSLAAGDLDGDGAADVVAAGQSVAVLLRAPPGGFLPPALYDLADYSHEVVLGHLDADSDLDVVYTEGDINSAESLTVRLGDGQGELGAAFTLQLVNPPDALALGDMDGDGDDDVAFVSQDQDRLSLVLSDGTGGLLPPAATLNTGNGPNDVVTGDLNADGVLDLVTANTLGNSLSVFLGHGSLGYSPMPQLAAPAASELLLGDVDLDGDADLVSGPAILTFLGAGDGTFAPGQPAGTEGSLVALADTDGNGFADLVVANSGFLVLTGPGFSAGSPAEPMPLGAFGAAVLDVDSDGLQDVLVGDFYAEHVAELRGTGFGGLQGHESVPLPTFAPSAFALGDLDGDSDVDVACATQHIGQASGGTVVVFNDGAGGLGPPIATHLTFSADMRDIASGDIDGDGHADLVSVLEHVGLTIQLGVGGGDFATAFDVPVGPHPLKVELADLDGDGDDDAVSKVLLDDLSGGPAEVLLGSGGTLLPAGTVPIGASLADLQLADVNGDALLDVVGFANGEGIRVFPGRGTGLFAPGVLTPLSPAALDLEVGDIDVDGFPDLVVLHYPPGKDTLTVLRGDGSGTFAEQQVLVADEESHGVALTDLDADGFPDLLSGGGIYGNVLLRFDNNGAGTFGARSFYALGIHPWDVAAADLNGDGRPDVLTLLHNSFDPADGGMTLLLNLGPDEPWTWLGQGKAGAAGVPVLVGKGTLMAGEPVSLELQGAAPSASTVLVLGLAAAFLPFKGGVLVPQPDVLVGLVTDAQGGALLETDWPPGVPAGLPTWYQTWVLDGSATLGLSASNGLTASAP